jgi:hypothetical protein
VHERRFTGRSFKLVYLASPRSIGPVETTFMYPVKADISSSRPAGTPLRYDGWLYRPAQDCSKSISRPDRIVLNRVARLTPTEFEEEPAATVEPYANETYADAIHTVSAVGNFTLIDGTGLRFVPSAFGRAVTQGSIEMIRSAFGRFSRAAAARSGSAICPRRRDPRSCMSHSSKVRM